ncbi:chemotaxis protein CheD [Leptothrix discophora]|uniref:Chemotaxis protein CheD n=1 Tax=Leptothrix discophora TaxID=89 RepID=A0ABT9G0I2_LEPDI|nr:chemotaxis protein CheD [Leptothrix discophora]MDP4299982.1 chemotaxis protein CheD [Leptothrix discophora]
MPALTAPASLADVFPPPRVHLLNPGDVVVAASGNRLDTLLGSCVAVTLVDPRGTIGAMCHIVHASDSDARRAPDTHHARDALQAMADGLLARGIAPRLCLARVYGGANMFPGHYPSRYPSHSPGHDPCPARAGNGEGPHVPQQVQQHVGQRNVARVLELLAAGGIRVVEQSVGGNGYRKLSWRIGLDLPQCTVVDAAAPSDPA